MKSAYLILVGLVLTIHETRSESLVGTWSHCITDDQDTDTEHIVTFEENNIEREVHVMKGKSTSPCQGEPEFLLGTYWHYHTNGTTFTSTTFSHFVKVLNSETSKNFGKKNLCSESKWEIGKEIDCSKDNVIMQELGDMSKRGYRSSRDYFVKEQELHILSNGSSIVFRKISKSPF